MFNCAKIAIIFVTSLFRGFFFVTLQLNNKVSHCARLWNLKKHNAVLLLEG